MQIDVLDLITPDPSFMATSYLDGDHPNITYLDRKNGVLAYLKGLAGYPWDILIFNCDWIFQHLTELKWSDPRTGKLRTGNNGKGGRRFPRWIVPGDFVKIQFVLSRPETDYIIYDAVSPSQPYGVPESRNSNNFERCTFSGPFPGPAVGDLPAGVDWRLDFERNGTTSQTFPTMEQLLHRTAADGRAFGRWKWQQFKWSSANVDWIPDTDAAGKPIASQTTTIKQLIQPVIPIQKVY